MASVRSLLAFAAAALLAVVPQPAAFMAAASDTSAVAPTPTPTPSAGYGYGTDATRGLLYSQFMLEGMQSRVNWTLHHAVEEVLLSWYLNKTPIANSILLSGLALGFPNRNATHEAAATAMALSVLRAALQKLYAGGNDGWYAWPLNDVYLRFRSFWEADTTLYLLPTSFDPLILVPPTSNYTTINEMFSLVIRYSIYTTNDQTSNHHATDGSARLLAEQAFPGQIVCNFTATDPTAAGYFGTEMVTALTKGYNEYGSPDYGSYNFLPYLSLAQLLTSDQYKNISILAKTAFETCLLQSHIYYNSGNRAMSNARGYPITGFWGVSSESAVNWVYSGGSFPTVPANYTTLDEYLHSSIDNNRITSFTIVDNVKWTSLHQVLFITSGYTPSVDIAMIGAVPFTRRVRSSYFGNHQISYITANYSHYSESNKHANFLPLTQSYRSRVTFLKSRNYNIDAGAFAVHPCASMGWVNTTTYEIIQVPTRSSGTLGNTIWEEFMQIDNTVMHTYFIPAVSTTDARFAAIFLPVPNVNNSAQSGYYLPFAEGEQWIAPRLSADQMRLYVAYETVFVAFLSDSPISLRTFFNVSNNAEWAYVYNVYGGGASGPRDVPTTPLTGDLKFVIVVETSSPWAYSGATFQERFNTFVTFHTNNVSLPAMIQDDPVHPVFQYTTPAGKVMTTQFSQDKRWAINYTTRGTGNDWIGLPWNDSSTLVDYVNWPVLSMEALMPDNLDVQIPSASNSLEGYSWRTWAYQAINDTLPTISVVDFNVTKANQTTPNPTSSPVSPTSSPVSSTYSLVSPTKSPGPGGKSGDASSVFMQTSSIALLLAGLATLVVMQQR